MGADKKIDRLEIYDHFIATGEYAASVKKCIQMLEESQRENLIAISNSIALVLDSIRQINTEQIQELIKMANAALSAALQAIDLQYADKIEIPEEFYQTTEDALSLSDEQGKPIHMSEEIQTVLEGRPKKVRRIDLKELLYLLISVLSLTVPIVQSHVASIDQAKQNQQVIQQMDQLQEELESQTRLYEQMLERIQYAQDTTEVLDNIGDHAGDSHQTDGYDQNGDSLQDAADGTNE